MYLVNAFSINMLPPDGAAVEFRPISISQAAALLRSADGVTNAIGHADTAALVASVLQAEGYTPPPAERINVRLTTGLTAIVAQYTGPRLPEGATSLPEGAQISFWAVTISK